jgi:hypothetical protein
MVDSLNALAKRSETKGSIFLFLRWLDANKTDPAIYYFIETLLREHIYKSLYSNYNQNYQKQYEAYLASIISSPHPEVKARAVYQLCVLWKEWSLKYARDDYRYANYGQFFDTSYQQYAGKAVRLYDENRQLFKSYGFLQQQLEQLRTEILFPKLQILLDNEHEKNKPLLLKIQYKNVPVFYYRIVRLNFDEELSTSTTNKGFLLSHEMVGEEKIDLPLPLDYNPHRVFLKLPSLSSGKYCLVFSSEPIDSAKTYSYQSFVVSDIAFLHTDDRVYVLNRGSGMPVKGAFILATSAKKNVAERKFRTNEKGFFILPLEGDFALTATYNGDTLRGKVSSNKRDLPDEVFSKEEYEDLVEYYDENSSVMIFTDRGIYRPGQKVFFKAVVITKNPSTGEMMIMSEQNLKTGYRNYLK